MQWFGNVSGSAHRWSRCMATFNVTNSDLVLLSRNLANSMRDFEEQMDEMRQARLDLKEWANGLPYELDREVEKEVVFRALYGNYSYSLRLKFLYCKRVLTFFCKSRRPPLEIQWGSFTWSKTLVLRRMISLIVLML